mmetsp:Transcript_11505/g.16264  ORF Transcript_11505/g.16264 Transcript_11505/m.16264 type:complete len:126 (-) Transcript_11505:2137-2514(-)
MTTQKTDNTSEKLEENMEFEDNQNKEHNGHTMENKNLLNELKGNTENKIQRDIDETFKLLEQPAKSDSWKGNTEQNENNNLHWGESPPPLITQQNIASLQPTSSSSKRNISYTTTTTPSNHQIPT